MPVTEFFEVLGTSRRTFHFRLSGFLSSEVLETHAAEIEQRYQRAVDSFAGKRFLVYADLRGLKPLSEKANELVQRLMAYGMARGLYFSVNIVPSTLATISIRKAGQQTQTAAVRATVGTEAEAEALLAEKRAELEKADAG